MREEARSVCLTACPELEACRAYALARHPAGEVGILAGMSTAERLAERRRRKQLAELRQRSGMAAVNKAKIRCGICGEPLAGPNLMVTRDRNGGKHRGCRNCHRRRVASSRRLARALRKARQQAAA
jgi:Transcription factor WhiB